MARETRPPRLYESPAIPRALSSTSAPLGSSFNANRAAPSASLSLAKSALLKSASLSSKKASTPRPRKKKTSLERSTKPASQRMSSHAAAPASSGWESDDGGFNITADSGRSLPGSERKQPTQSRKVSGGKTARAGELNQTIGKGKAREGQGRLMTPPSSQPTGEDEQVDARTSQKVASTSLSYHPLSPQSQPHPSSSRHGEVSTTPKHAPPSTSSRAPSLPAQASPTVAFPSVRRATSHAPISPLKVSALSRSRKRTTSSTLSSSSSTAQAPSPNPRARKQPKSALAASASLPVGAKSGAAGFSLSTPVAAPSKVRAAPRTDRPVASKPFHSSQPTVRKKSTLSQSTSSQSSSRRRSAPPPRSLSVLPDEGIPLGSITLPDTPPPPRSPGDDPILLKGKERVRAYVPQEGDESILMATDDGDDMDLMASIRGRPADVMNEVKEEDEHVGDLSMATTMGGAADESDDDGEDANITYNPQASPSRPRPSTSSLIAGPRSIAASSSLVPTASSSSVASGSGVRQPSLPLFLSSVVHSTPLSQRSSMASRPSDPVTTTTPAFPPRLNLHHQANPTPGGYTPSAYASAIQTPAPALSPYTFQQPGTPESYSGSEDDRDERMFNRERSDSFLADMQTGQDGEEAVWAAKMRSSLSPDSSDREDEPEMVEEAGDGEWDAHQGDDAGMDFGRWDETDLVERPVEEQVLEEAAVERSVEEEPAAVVQLVVSAQVIEREDEAEEAVPSPTSSQDRRSLSDLDRSSPAPTPDNLDRHDVAEAESVAGAGEEEESQPVLPVPSAVVESARLSPPPEIVRDASPRAPATESLLAPDPEREPESEIEVQEDVAAEQESEPAASDEAEEEEDSFLVVVEQKSLAEEIAEMDTPNISATTFDTGAIIEEDEQAEDSFSENDLDDGPTGFDSDSGESCLEDEIADEPQWEDEAEFVTDDEGRADMTQASMLDDEEELYLNESSRDLLEAAGMSFFSTVTSPSPVKRTAHMSSPSKTSAGPSSSTPARRVPTPFAAAAAAAAAAKIAVAALADQTQDYVVELNDVSHEPIEVEDESFVSTSTTYDSPSLPRGGIAGSSSGSSRSTLPPKRLSLQMIGQLDNFFKDRAGSLSPSVGSAGGSPSPRLANFPTATTSATAAAASFRAPSTTSLASGSQGGRRTSIASSTQSTSDRPTDLYPSLADVMMRKQQMMGSNSGREDVLVRERSSERDESMEEETYIKISSNDPREAARATAFLKMFHDYVEPDPSSLDPNSSFTSTHSRKSGVHFPTPAARRSSTTSSRRRRSSNNLADVSMMSAADILMEAEQEIAAEFDAATEDASPDEEAEESFAIPGSYEPISVLVAAKEPKKEKTKSTKGKQRASSTRDRAWGTAEWRCLMGCLDVVTGGRKDAAAAREVDEDVVVDAFLVEMGLVDRDLEGEWVRSKLHTRIASILQRRQNEAKLGITPSRRRRSHHPHKAFISPNKAAGNMSLGSIATPAPRSPIRRTRNVTSGSAAIKPAPRRTSLAGKVLGFLGGWLGPSPAPAPQPESEMREARPRRKRDAPVARSPPRSNLAPHPRQPSPIASSSRNPFTATAPPFTPAPPTIIPPSSPITSTPLPSSRSAPSLVATASKPIAIPARPRSTTTNQPRPRQSHARSPVKVSELVRSFESVRSLGEEEQERVRSLERKGSRGSLRGD